MFGSHYAGKNSFKKIKKIEKNDGVDAVGNDEFATGYIKGGGNEGIIIFKGIVSAIPRSTSPDRKRSCTYELRWNTTAVHGNRLHQSYTMLYTSLRPS